MKPLKTNALFALLLLALFSVASCGGDDEPSCTEESAISELFTLLFSYESIETAYESDPVANCAEYKTALQEFVQFLENNKSCLGEAQFTDDQGDPLTIDQAISNTNTEISNLDC